MSTVTVISDRKSRRGKVFRRLFWRRTLSRLVREADLTALTPETLANTMGTVELSAIRRLWRRIERIGNALLHKGRIDSARHQALTDFLKKSDPLMLAQTLSPYHTLLLEKEFYRASDAATRLALQRSAARFARRHRLPPASAVLLWEGESASPRRKTAGLLLLPLPLTLMAALFGAQTLPLTAALLMLLTLPAVFTGGYLLIAALLRKLLPAAPLPLLKKGSGHPLLTVGVGRVEEADRALEGMARIAAAGQSDSRYLLVLTLSDGLLGEGAGEAERIAALKERVDSLAQRLDIPISLLIPPRRYEPRQKRWRGQPTLTELAALLAETAAVGDPAFEAVCLLPADAAILPGSEERLSAALFHPLCKNDALVFLSPADSPLPGARLAVLRQCLLQKLDAPADLPGWGIYRRDALHKPAAGESVSPRLTAQPLYSSQGGEVSPYEAPRKGTPSLLPTLRWLLPALRMALLFGMVASGLSLSYCLLLWFAASADLFVSALLSVRLNHRFFLYTLPAWKRIGIALLHRTLLPVGELWKVLGGDSLIGLSLASLLFGAAVIIPGAPLSFLGLCWSIAPLLAAETSSHPELLPSEKGACHALAKELYPLLREGGAGLPPAYLTASRERAPYTTPITLGTHLAAELAACDLGIIDPYTLERRVDALLSRLEKLPTRGGLPYARYSVETDDYYKDSHVDSAACGVYALCLAAVEAGLLEHAARQPALYPLAQRIAHLSMQMDFTLLLREDHTLCRTLTPEGEQQGQLSYLFGGGGIALYAALASDSTLGMGGGEKAAAWQSLLSPAALQKGRCLLRSANGALDSYLLPNLLLPAPQGSLIPYAAQQALRTVMGEGKRADKRSLRERLRAVAAPVKAAIQRWIPARLFSRSVLPANEDPAPALQAAAPLQKAYASRTDRIIRIGSLLTWPHLSRRPRPLTAGHDSLCPKGEYIPRPITAPLLCLLINENPRLALSHLRALQENDPFGGFADPTHPEQIPLSGLSLSLIALGGAATQRQFAKRLLSIPRCGALYPLLFRRPDSAVEGHAPRVEPPAPKEQGARSPSVCLLGNAAHGLLIAKGQGISLWAGGAPLTAPTAANGLFATGRMSGLLLLRDSRLLPLPRTVHRREAGALTLTDEGMTCRISRTAGGWSLCWERSEAASAEVRFLLCPAAKGMVRLSEELFQNNGGTSVICLCIELSPSLTIAVTAEGLTDAFTHADPSPWPRGSRQAISLFALPPKRAQGICPTPSCMIGGHFTEKTLTVRLVVAASKSAALAILREPAPLADPSAPLPLPAPDGSLAARVLEWQLRALFSGAPIPSVMAVGGSESEQDHFARCISGGKEVLSEKGFPIAAKVPAPLAVNRREGAEALITRLLAEEVLDAQTPLLPTHGTVHYSDACLQVRRGRDIPRTSRTYSNRIATLYADPEALRFCPCKGAETIPLSLLLTPDGRQLLLPAAATAVTYSPGEAVFAGEGFTLRLALLPKLPLLSIRLNTKESAELSLPSLPSPHKNAEAESFWYLSDGRVLFCRRLSAEDEIVWLIGSFPRERDHLYYWMREAITLRTLPGIVDSYDSGLQKKSALLRMVGEDAPPLPAVLAAVLTTDSPVRALLSPLYAPEDATADLVRLAQGEPTLLLPMALAIRVAVTDDLQAANLRIPVDGGRVSLYLCAARCLERAMEEDCDNPLLPPLVAAFARLSEQMGDHTGQALYSAFEKSAPPAPDRRWNSLPDAAPATVELLAALGRGDVGAAEALWNAISTLPTDPNPADAALLWSGALWGVLGFIPGGDGFTLAPPAAEREMTFLLSYKGEWRVHLRPGEAPLCTRADTTEGAPLSARQTVLRQKKSSPRNFSR